MENWIEIISFTLPQDAYLVKGRLESEGIDITLKDELTTQVYNFYSNAIGGVKLLVQEKDYDRAYKILVENKYIQVEEKKINKFLKNFDRLTSNLPFIGKSILELRLLITVTVFLIIIIVPIALLSLPSTSEKLTNNIWCTESIYLDGKKIKLNPYGIHFITRFNSCSESIEFRKNGEIIISGVGSYPILNNWELINDSIIIRQNNLHTDTTTDKIIVNEWNSIFAGKYKLDISGNYIKMKSSRIIIIGRMN